MEQQLSSNDLSKVIFSSLMLLLIAAAIGTFAFWAHASSLDVITRAQGIVIPSSRIQSVQTYEGGVLSTIAVKEGDYVEKGQVILRLDRVRTQASYSELLSKVKSLEVAKLRLEAEVQGKAMTVPKSQAGYEPIVTAQRELFQKRVSSLNEDLAVLQKSLALAQKELALNEPLLTSGEVSEVDIIRLRRQVNEINGSIAQRKSKFFNESQSELAKVNDELSTQKEALTGRRDTLQRLDIVAPMNGVVKNVRVTTVGGVVRPAEEILQIVPVDDELFIEIKINPADVAFLKPGLPVSVKFDAYDYSIYGSLKGELTYLSPDSLREETAKDDVKYFRGMVRTKGSKLRNPRSEKIEIIPGMTATAEITTGQRTVMQYLLKPLNKSLQDSLHER